MKQPVWKKQVTRWWFPIFLGIFNPIPGEMMQFDELFFQMGWFNHQTGSRLMRLVPSRMVEASQNGKWLVGSPNFLEVKESDEAVPPGKLTWQLENHHF